MKSFRSQAPTLEQRVQAGEALAQQHIGSSSAGLRAQKRFTNASKATKCYTSGTEGSIIRSFCAFESVLQLLRRKANCVAADELHQLEKPNFPSGSLLISY